MNGISRIAVIRLLPGLGDMLCAVPALRALRRGAPDAEITLVGLSSSEWMCARYPHLVGGHLEVPAWPGLPEACGELSDTVRALATARERCFDLAVQLHGTGWYVNELTLALGAVEAAGHHPPGHRAPPGRWRPWPAHGHEIERLADMVRWLGFPDAGHHLELDEQPGDLRDAAPVLERLRDPYVVVHPGASRPDRRWRLDGFVRVVDRLHTSGRRVLVTGLPREATLIADLRAACRIAPMPVIGLGIGALAAVLRRACGVVSNDTGVAHLAVACDVPTVVVITTSDADRWSPLDRERHRVVRMSARRRVDDDVSAVMEAAAEVVGARVPSGMGVR